MSNPQVTILIPNYKTPELTKLCLRLLRKNTDPQTAKVIVIDNNSQDESLTYLRGLSWIELIERPGIAGESPALSHSRALDAALARVTTPYVLSIHTDTLVKNSQWLDFLIKQIERDTQIAGVGSWKLENISWFKKLAKAIEAKLQKAEESAYYLRSHCALYRTDLLKKFQLTFSDGGEVAGKVLHEKLVGQGYQMVFLPSETLLYYMEHINHATMVLNPDLGTRKKSVNKGLRRIQKSLEAFNAAQVLSDGSLDK